MQLLLIGYSKPLFAFKAVKEHLNLDSFLILFTFELNVHREWPYWRRGLVELGVSLWGGL